MRLLHWILAVPEQLPSNNFPVKWGLPPKIHPELGMGRGHFSTLWSDVGQFYETCGPFGDKKRSWMLRSPISTIWKVGCTGTELSQGNWRWLNHEEIGRLWDRDESAMQQEQAAMASVTTRPILLTYLPGNGTESFQRLDILPYTRNIVPPMDTWGVALDMDLPSTAFATWTVEVKPTSLTVTRLRASPSQFETIVARLLEVAERHGMTKVEIWNLPEELRGVSAQTGGVTGARQGHLPYICSYWPEDSDEIEWCFNERSVCRALICHISLIQSSGSAGASVFEYSVNLGSSTAVLTFRPTTDYSKRQITHVAGKQATIHIDGCILYSFVLVSEPNKCVYASEPNEEVTPTDLGHWFKFSTAHVTNTPRPVHLPAPSFWPRKSIPFLH